MKQLLSYHRIFRHNRSYSCFICLLLFLASLVGTTSLQAQGCLDATVYLRRDITDPLTPGPGKMYAFRGDEYSKLDWSANSFATPYEWRIDLDGTDGNDHIDAAFPTNEGYFFLISGSRILRVNQKSGDVVVDHSLTQVFPGLPAAFQTGIDAAWADDGTYVVTLIKGDQKVRYFRSQTTFSMTLLSGPVADAAITSYFPAGIDAAVYHPGSSYLYYQSGNEYIRIDSTGQVTAGYPLVYTNEWGNFPSNWSCFDPIDNSGACELGYKLPDFSCGDASRLSIEVSGLEGHQLGTDVRLEAVRLQIDHAFLSDLTLTLISPSGVEVLLADQLGGGDDDYGVGCGAPTVFRDDASIAITAGSSPFSNTYRPQASLASVHDGSDPNGTWQIKVCDHADGDLGALNLIQLEFAEADPIFTACNDPRGGIQIEVDWTAACQGGNLDNTVFSSMNAIGFHSGGTADVNEVWGTSVDWDSPTAVQATRRDADHFVTYIPDVNAYYGLSNVNRINFLFNQGIEQGGDAWAANLKAFAADGNCRDYYLLLSDVTETCLQSTSLQPRLAGPVLTLAPNPMHDRATLTFANTRQKTYEASLYDLTGRQVRSYPGIQGGELEILRGELPAGLYLFTLTAESGAVSSLKITLR